VTKHHDTTTVSPTVAHPDHLALLDDLKAAVAGLFRRREPRNTFWDLVSGLLMGLPSANCWTIAEAVGHDSPYQLQHLLSRAAWNADAVLAGVARWITGRLTGPAILAVDETGDAKSSTDAAGAAKQYSGALGGVGLCQVAVHLSLATPAGHAVIGRRLYLGAGWAADDERRTLAGVPDEVEFATKPDLAITLIRQAVAAGVRAGYVTADEVYGSVAFRTACRSLGLAYVVATPANRQITTPDHRRRACADAARLIPATAWARMRTGSATKGAKDYDWAMLAVEPDDTPDDDTLAEDMTSPATTRATGRPAGHSVLLMRRHRYTRTISYFRCWTPAQVSLADLVAVVCARWHIEEDFQLTKRTVGLDQGQVRTWTSWHRRSAAALTAYAFLVAGALLENQAAGNDEDTHLVPVSCPELQHLLTATVLPAPRRDPGHVQRWSHWRRRHQATARDCHRAWNAYADTVA
jgi:SRSO17 transposase